MNKLWILLFIACFWACNDDDDRIVADISTEAFSFKPIAGGAIMHYVLPDDPNIVGVMVRYQNAEGLDILRTGSCTCDSVLLTGFNEGMTNVKANVSLCYVGDRESEPIEVMFNTEDSAPVSFLKSAEVFSNWGGFTVSFDNPDPATGMAHVFYVGFLPNTNLQDTILLESFFLMPTDGTKNLSYMMAQDIVDPTVVIRAEDFRGVMVGEKVWENVKTLVQAKLDKSDFEFYCTNSIESDYDKLGVQYLFDGDLKGVQSIKSGNGRLYSFLAGPYAAGENATPMYLDLKKNRVLASVRLYTMYDPLDIPGIWRQYNGFGFDYDLNGAQLARNYVENELPCKVTLYGLKDDGAAVTTDYDVMNSKEGWEEIASFEQEKDALWENRWYKDARHQANGSTRLESEEILTTADSVFMGIDIPAIKQEEGYRYLKIVVDEVFDLEQSSIPDFLNTFKYVSFHELEVWTDKE